jgi:hypothetical protein
VLKLEAHLMSNRIKHPKTVNDNGEPVGAAPVADRAAELLKEAVANPGAAGIPDEVPEVSGKPLAGIPEESLDPAAGVVGESLDDNPATMTVGLSRPGPQTWLQLFPDMRLRTVMLSVRERREDAPIYYYLAPELRPAVKEQCRDVTVCLAFDVAAEGEFFLWAVVSSERSPYYCALSRALALGEQALQEKVFQFSWSDDARKVKSRQRLRDADDPVAVPPTRPLGVLLEEALGDRIIRSANHPIYYRLTRGSRLP